ncbi:filamentous haemagglutinin family protein [Methylomonas koyamae]|uniref:filamentous haemagglutinin family protein n=1 Tax=Methylomonas koyamae TaxID=702114 RepID=UPI000BC2D892|nr:filamentous haemagglutinin family protein [Methylomonas koyamae]ATG92344.1 hypothetical protein MKLM6_4174 [Methylomonas koyamae]
MKPLRAPIPVNETSLCASIGRILAGGVLALSGAAEIRADANLPQPLNAGLTHPELHPGINVGQATADYSADGLKLTVNQTTDKAVLDWHSFDIAAGHSVQFVQPGATSIALNNIHQLDASKIYGNLSANGQVYLVNANGFIFGKEAAVNANTLVATTLKISDQVFEKGISKVVDANAAPGAGNADPVAALTADGSIYRELGNGKREKIRILVEAGAKVAAAAGGRVVMAAPDVENRGTIAAPDGQVILAAATDKVYLQESDDDNLRGLLVEVQTGGNVKNVGKILTERGNTTMMGFAVAQQGIVSASTSVALNGSVRLLAREGARLEADGNRYVLKPATTTRASAGDDGLGTLAGVTLSDGSLTEVALDASAGTAVAGQSQPKSRIDIAAGQIRVKAGAAVVTHGGNVNLTASEAPAKPLSLTSPENASTIVLEQGSKIDVSGVKNVQMAMSDNVVGVELRNDELRDAPLQKTGILHGKTVFVDVRSGTPLADISGALSKVRHSVEERNIDAGNVNLSSEGQVNVEQGADIDLSGGSLHYLGGHVTTTKLVSGSRIVDIAAADPNLTYQKILTASHYEADYYQGGDAGTLNIKARELALAGNLNATTVNSLHQRSADSWALGGALTIDTVWSKQRQQDIVFGPGTGADLSAAVPISLSNALFSRGVNRIGINSGGKLSVPQTTSLVLAPAGSLKLQAGEIEWQGRLLAPAGDVGLQTVVGQDPTRNLSGQIHLAAPAGIDASGSWINDALDSRNLQTLQALTLNGGNIALHAQGDLLIDAGSRLSANGGAALTAKNKIRAGTGGNIELAGAGIEPSRVAIAAALSAYGLEQGGSLRITANALQIGGAAGSDANTLYLDSALLAAGGFRSYRLTANAGNLALAAGSSIRLQQRNWQLNAAAIHAASGSDLSQLVHLAVLPDDQRSAVDLSLNLLHNPSINGGYDADRILAIAAGAVIAADAGAEIGLTSDTDIRVDGTIRAPAGKIALALTAPPSAIKAVYNPDQAISLGNTALLDAGGTLVPTTNSLGLKLGQVLAGGTVSLTADRGYLLTAAGSRIDVSGSQAQVDIVNAAGKARPTIGSAGGSINLTAAEGMILQGQLRAAAGQGQAATGTTRPAGGGLSVTLDAQRRAEPEDTVFTTGDRVIHIGAVLPALPDAGILAAGGIDQSLNGQAYLSAAQIAAGGFDALALTAAVIEPDQYADTPLVPEAGAIRFDGDVELALAQSLILDAPLISGNGKVALSANTFRLGSSLNRAAHGKLAGASAAADFSVAANLIELQGSSQIDGFGQIRFSSAGELRLSGVRPNGEADLAGSLEVAGNLTLTARQVYPTTFSRYRIAIDADLNPDGTLDILPAGGAWATPYSAAGALALSAPHIASRGVLLAPFGSIDLQAGKSLTLTAGSVTSVSDDDGITIPFGRSQGGLDWTYPLGNYRNIQNGAPQKTITLVAPDIDLAAGAKVNLNGGGELSAFEFVAGPGGSRDVLDTNGAYAIVPAYRFEYAAYDPLEFAASGLTPGDSIYLSADSGLPAGSYVLLPAHYALLDNAYLITPQAGTTDMAAGTTAVRSDGASIVAGYRYLAGTNVADSRWSGFAVEPGAIARTRSEYQETTASRFFAAAGGAGLPSDAGNLGLAAQRSLLLAAGISATAAAGGLGGMLDIGADRLTVVNQRSAQPGAGVELLAGELNRLGVDSLLLGGRRSRNGAGTELAVAADQVAIAAGVELHAPEVILAASDTVRVEAGAAIAASGKLSRSDARFNVRNADFGSDGALLRVSAAGQAGVLRAADGLTGSAGTLDVAAGANLSAAGSILLDASKDSLFAGSIAMERGELALSSSRIALGASNGNGGLQLSEAALNALHADKLVLNSYGAIDIAGTLAFQLQDLTLNAATINGYAGQAGQIATIDAKRITLGNGTGAASAELGTGSADLALSADTLTLAGGNYAWSGFGRVRLTARDALVDSGTSAIDAHSDLVVSAPVWTARAGANTTLNLAGHSLTTLAGAAASTQDALGARLAVNAGSITHAGRIEMAAGVVKLNADVDLNVSGSIDTSGRDVDLAGNHIYTGGGSIALNSAGGNLNLAETAALNVSGSPLGGDGGSLILSAAAGKLTLNGTWSGRGYQTAVGGNFALDAKTVSVADFSAINAYLAGGGFDGDIGLRLRSGDWSIAAGDTLAARNIAISVDRGRLDVAGSLDASAAQAGAIRLAAGDELHVLAGARLRAVSSAAGKTGGSLALIALDADGDGRHGASIAGGAQIDVSGGAGGKGGSVDLTVARTGADDAAVAIAPGTVAGAAMQRVTATAQYRDAVLSNSAIAQWRDQTEAYMAAAGNNQALNARLGGFSLQPGLDVQSQTDLTLDLTQSLKSASWTQVGSGSKPIWSTQLPDSAGLVNALQQVSKTGAIGKSFNNAGSMLVTAFEDGSVSYSLADNSYYYDANPQSPTYRTLFLQIAGNPKNLSDTLVAHNGWDFNLAAKNGADWRYGAGQTPGVLSLRSAGNLAINQNLSDGFALYDDKQLAELLGQSSCFQCLRTQVLQTGLSWSFDLVAGADLSAADLLAVQISPAAGNLSVGSATSVRTGTGAINAAAAGDIRLADSSATIYTAGRTSVDNRWGNLNPAAINAGFFVEYPFDGGNIGLSAGGNVVGAASNQFMSDWLQRAGNWNPNDGIGPQDRPTTWGIMFDGLGKDTNNYNINNKLGFRENVGALGGGNVSVKAGADIRDLSVMLPTSAKPVGDGSHNEWQVLGGGDLTVVAGGDIAGGVFYVDRGSATLRAAGAVGGGSQFKSGPVIALGDVRVRVEAGSGIEIGSVLNPLALPKKNFLYGSSYFTRYGSGSGIALQTLAGDLVLNNDTKTIAQEYKVLKQDPKIVGKISAETFLASSDLPLLALYPGDVSASSLSGDLKINDSMSLFPAAGTSLNLLAYGDLAIGSEAAALADGEVRGTTVNQLDVDPAKLLSPAQPATTAGAATQYLFTTVKSGQEQLVHAAVPVHWHDQNRNLIAAATGSLLGFGNATLATAKASELYSGLDLANLNLKLQNLHADDETRLLVGRDLVYPIVRDAVFGRVEGASAGLELAGPGYLQVWAGRNVDLGSSLGITTVGPSYNPALPASGASIVVLAGSRLGSDPAPLNDFLHYYVERGSYHDLAAELDRQTGNGGRLALALRILFEEIRLSAQAAATSGGAARDTAYQRGYAAIARLFPDSPGGDIELFFSRIQTLYGGDIDLLAPGGMLNVGLASLQGLDKTEDELGIVAQRDGHVNVLANGDVRVNQSRVFTLDGGDIAIWSSTGNIDAGRGAKAAIATPAPKVTRDANGNLVVVFPATVSGSGIRAQSGFNANRIGNVTLAAPKGVVDAGEAGIGGQNVTIAATAVIGASNIQVSGNSVGFGQTVAAPAVPLAAASAAAAASRSAASQEPTASGPDDKPAAGRSVKAALLDAQVVGFGQCSVADVKAGKPGCS